MKETIKTERLANYQRIFLLEKRFPVSTNKLVRFNKKILGVGMKQFLYLMMRVGINKKASLNKLGQRKLEALSLYARQVFLLERELKAQLKQNIHLKIKNNLYVGVRLRQGLPAYGQRTKSNANTVKRQRR